MNLKGQVALVTGGSSGIGKAISTRLAQMGADVVINYYKGLDAGPKLAKELEQTYGIRAIAMQANVASFDEAKQLIDNVIGEFGKLNIVVNNSGITEDNLILRMSEEQFDSVIDTNLKGVFNICKHSARHLLKADNARLINITSVAGRYGNAGQANYSASKAGVIGITKTLAKEFASRKVTVNAVSPGLIETKMTQKLSDSIKEEMVKQIGMKELGKVEDVAYLVGFLASKEAGYITGTVIDVDGGLLM